MVRGLEDKWAGYYNLGLSGIRINMAKFFQSPSVF